MMGQVSGPDISIFSYPKSVINKNSSKYVTRGLMLGGFRG
jgi:hypothetical protein